MNERTPFMWLFIIILVAFVAGWVHVTRLNARKPSSIPFRHAISHHQPVRHQEPSSRIDFTEILDEQSKPSSTKEKSTASLVNTPNKGNRKPTTLSERHPDFHQTERYSAEPIANPATKPLATSARLAPRGISYQTTPVQSQARTTYIPANSSKQTVKSVSSATTSSSATPATTNQYPAPKAYRKIKAIQQDSAEKQTRGDWMDGYMPRQTLEEQQEMNRKVKQFSDALDAAIAKAFPNKSKRQQNIEKYMPHKEGEEQTGSTTAAAATANLKQQLASQTKAIVGDMAKSYGSSVAGKAAQIMKNFQQEMEELIDSDMDPMEKQVAAQRINNKYNKQLRQLNKQAATEKMREQMRSQNEQYLQKFAEIYGAQPAAEMRPVMEDYMRKQIELMQTPMTEEESLKAKAELEEQLRKAQEEVLMKTAAGTKGDLTIMNNDQIRDLITNIKEDNTPIYSRTDEEKEAAETKFTSDKEEILAGFQNQDIRAQVQQRFDEYERERKILEQEAEKKRWTELEYARKLVPLTDKFNEGLSQDKVRDLNESSAERYKKQYGSAVQSDLKEVYSRFNEQRVALFSTARSNKEREEALQKIDEQEQQEIQKIIAKFSRAN